MFCLLVRHNLCMMVCLISTSVGSQKPLMFEIAWCTTLLIIEGFGRFVDWLLTWTLPVAITYFSSNLSHLSRMGCSRLTLSAAFKIFSCIIGFQFQYLYNRQKFLIRHSRNFVWVSTKLLMFVWLGINFKNYYDQVKWENFCVLFSWEVFKNNFTNNVSFSHFTNVRSFEVDSKLLIEKLIIFYPIFCSFIRFIYSLYLY